MLQIPSTMNTNNQPNGPKKESFKLQKIYMVYNLIKCVQWTLLNINVNIVYPLKFWNQLHYLILFFLEIKNYSLDN
jgi:hypothetical protein